MEVKSSAMYTTRKISYFDIFEPEAEVLNSDIKGFYLSFIVMQTIYITCSSYVKLTTLGTVRSHFDDLITEDLLLIA